MADPTHVTDLLFILTKGLVENKFEVIESHYILDGAKAVILDHLNGKRYGVEIYPLDDFGKRHGSV